MLKNAAIFGLLSLCLTACGGLPGTANKNASNAANTPNTNSANTASNAANTANTAANTANTNANANTAKPADNGPKRITFEKGASSHTEGLTLAPGASKQFVVTAKKGQFLVAEPDSNRPSPEEVRISLLTKGKADISDLSAFLSATLNADGDYVFEVKNLTKKEIKLGLRVQIDNGPQ